jgi:CTP-dependent riboflavin kinase
MDQEYHGVVFTGLGISAMLCKLNMEVYRQVCGLDLVPGTLNLRLARDFIVPGTAVRIAPEKIKPLSKNQSVTIVPATIYKEKVFILLPEKSGYEKNVIEILAPFYLRQRFGLKDGSNITVTV